VIVPVGPLEIVAVKVTESPYVDGVPDVVTLNVGRTWNKTPLLVEPLTATTKLPEVAPAGTVVTIEVLLQLLIEVAAVPLNITVLVP
jgi:hypothetical protein